MRHAPRMMRALASSLTTALLTMFLALLAYVVTRNPPTPILQAGKCTARLEAWRQIVTYLSVLSVSS